MLQLKNKQNQLQNSKNKEENIFIKQKLENLINKLPEECISYLKVIERPLFVNAILVYFDNAVKEDNSNKLINNKIYKASVCKQLEFKNFNNIKSKEELKEEINQEKEENDFIEQAVKILRKTVEKLDEKLFILKENNYLNSKTNQTINQKINEIKQQNKISNDLNFPSELRKYKNNLNEYNDE
uniref:Uncharacterized protein n=1 Tax=Meloidogyne hapla TaxID=6305 RepID=A0A1I8B5D5_MELHA